MRNARRFAALACAALIATAAAGVMSRAEAASRKSAPVATAKKGADYRQFTGVVVSLDATSLTVEKGGRTPKQMVFVRHAAMRSTGDVEKDARVTVYWREEAGKPVAHRVVVRPTAPSGSR
jgi:hypothetical protein